MKSKELKASAARAYESDAFNLALDEILHPGGLELTARLAEVAHLTSDSRVLDIASGRGTTAIFLAQRYLCSIVGIDLSPVSTSLAAKRVQDKGVAQKVTFAMADAECLPFGDSTFDAVISECAFSLLPDKTTGAREIVRVLKPGGKLAISDVVLQFPLSPELKTQVFFDSCFSRAETLEGYKKIFSRAGLVEDIIEDHSIELKKIAYKLVTGYGSISAFWEQFGRKTLSCCGTHEESCDDSRKLWKRLFVEGRPGYCLLSFNKSSK